MARAQQARPIHTPAAGLPGVNVPVSTIECITGSTGGHCDLQGIAAKALPQRRTHSLDRRHNAVRGFAVPYVGNGFAAAAVDSIAKFGHHHNRFGFTAAADREGGGQRPVFDLYGEFHAGANMTEAGCGTQGRMSIRP